MVPLQALEWQFPVTQGLRKEAESTFPCRTNWNEKKEEFIKEAIAETQIRKLWQWDGDQGTDMKADSRELKRF